MLILKKELTHIRTKLQEARKNFKLTQADVAKRLGVHTTSYQMIELGTRGASTEKWLKIHDIFNRTVPLHELMKNDPQQEDCNTRDKFLKGEN